MDGAWDPEAHWSTANLGEAAPGVLTPLGWSFWGTGSNRITFKMFAAFGALEQRRGQLPADQREWVIGLFYGRTALKVDFFCEMGDRLPGTDGAAVAEQFVGYVPDGFQSKRTYRRIPVFAVKFPWVFATLPRRLRSTFTEIGKWWAAQIAQTPSLNIEQARAQWNEASAAYIRTGGLQGLSLFVGTQPVFDQLTTLTEKAGMRDRMGSLLAGLGSHAEMAVIEDLWKLSRGNGDLESFLAVHGYHGPNAGDIASRVWREDKAPVLRLLEQYRQRPDSQSPDTMLQQRAMERVEASKQLLCALSPVQRTRARIVLKLAQNYIPLRGVGKVSYVQCIDVARSAARRVGELLTELQVIDHPEDIFYLTEQEMLSAAPGDTYVDIVAERRKRRESYLALELPTSWRGRPVPTVATDEAREVGTELVGVGASSGVAEGRVRVITDPADADIEPGEILVAPTTDPSWASIMFPSAGLVVDIGGTLSHAAVIARELGVPCVMNTGDGTKRLHTGDLCRVDGRRGTVQILKLAQELMGPSK